ncbi:MAG TPA: transporter substrate-binding domain-containing protein [Acetobacteraceae bacterium]|jgi:general L-amino acid transport system substrate-binding protein|nr:transporter substrate-binding domain-containing protein [Acetobacteraceae bacterium]
MVPSLYRYALLAGACLVPVLAVASPTLDKVRAARELTCGVVAVPEDWNKTDLHGPLAPLSIEICKAVAVAALGADAKLAVKPFDSELAAEQGLHKGETDLIVGVTPNATSMWHWNIVFGPPVFYDGQGFLVRKDLPVHAIADLAHRNVCVVEGTDNEKVLLARTVARGIPINPMPFQEEGEMDDGLAVRHCDAVSAYVSRLAQVKAAYPKQVGGDTILPGLLTLSPVAPAYRQGDRQWGMIVDWTVYALIQAEASEVTQANVAAERTSEDPVVQRLLGIDWATSRALGLGAHDWAAQVIAVVGNYGEIYDRTVGAHSALDLPRGLNALWTQGGLMHPLPVQ